MAMKRGLFMGILALMVWACAPVKEVTKTSATLVNKSNDTTEYEVIIMDVGFNQWYLKNFTEAKDHSNEYYQYNNLVAVSNWNNDYHAGRFDRVIDSYIDYRPDIDYGIDVNRKLFWYFKYVNSVYGIHLF